eukprot:UN23454
MNEGSPLLRTRRAAVAAASPRPSPVTNSIPSPDGNRSLGMFYLFLSCPVWAGLAVLVKVFSYLPVVEVLWLRYFVQWIMACTSLTLMTLSNTAPHQKNPNNRMRDLDLSVPHEKYKQKKMKPEEPQRSWEWFTYSYLVHNYEGGLDEEEQHFGHGAGMAPQSSFSKFLDATWGPSQSIDGRSIRWVVVLRALTDFLSICCFYFAISLIPVGDAASVFFQYNMMVFIAAYLCFGDVFGFLGVFNCIISICGVILTTQPEFIFGSNADDEVLTTFAGSQILGIVFALLGALFLTISIIGIRYSNEVHWIQMEQVAGLVSCVVTGPVLLLGQWIYYTQIMKQESPTIFVEFHGVEYLFCICLGLLGFLALCFMVQGYQNVESGTGALIAYLELPLTYILQAVLLKERPNWITWVGVVLIIVAASLQTIYSKENSDMMLQEEADMKPLLSKKSSNNSIQRTSNATMFSTSNEFTHSL